MRWCERWRSKWEWRQKVDLIGEQLKAETMYTCTYGSLVVISESGHVGSTLNVETPWESGESGECVREREKGKEKERRSLNHTPRGKVSVLMYVRIILTDSSLLYSQYSNKAVGRSPPRGQKRRTIHQTSQQSRVRCVDDIQTDIHGSQNRSPFCPLGRSSIRTGA